MIEIIMKGFANEGTSTQPHKTKAAYLRQRGSYQLDIVSFSELLKLEIPGTGLVLSLNPDLENPNVDYSVIPPVWRKYAAWAMREEYLCL